MAEKDDLRSEANIFRHSASQLDGLGYILPETSFVTRWNYSSEAMELNGIRRIDDRGALARFERHLVKGAARIVYVFVLEGAELCIEGCSHRTKKKNPETLALCSAAAV